FPPHSPRLSSLFEWCIGTMPLSDSSATFTRASRPWPSLAVLLPFRLSRNRGGLPVLVHEVSRRALGSATTRDCSRTRAGILAHAAFHHPYSVGIPIASFRSSIAQPACTPVYASPSASRQTTQNSGPSGSLLLSRKTLSFSTSCRFIPAHRERYNHKNRVAQRAKPQMARSIAMPAKLYPKWHE